MPWSEQKDSQTPKFRDRKWLHALRTRDIGEAGGSVLIGIATTIGVVGSIASFIAFFSPELGGKLTRRIRRAPTYNWAEIPRHIKNAKHRVFILQTWLPALRMELPCWSTAIEKDGIDFRVLLADQKLVPYRLRSREPVSSLLIQNVSDICEFIESLATTARSRVQVRFYNSLPFGPIYVVDDDVYWGLYLGHMDSMAGPVFRESVASRLGKEIINSFQAVWQDASERTGQLSVSEPVDRKKLDHAREEVEFTRRATIASRRIMRVERIENGIFGNRKGFLCIIRHAETDLSEAGIITGGLDVGINAVGRARLRCLGDLFEQERWSSIFTSPARRCTETLAELLKDESSVEIRDELRERAMGDMEGFSKLGYYDSLPQYKGFDIVNSFHARSRGGESYCDVFRRTVSFIEGQIESTLTGNRILICTHDTVIRMLILLLENRSIEEAVTLDVPNGEPLFYTQRD